MSIINKRIISLDDQELTILKLIYEIEDFKAIKRSRRVFRIETSQFNKFVWSSIYKFDSLELIKLKLDNNFIVDVEYYTEVDELIRSVEYPDLRVHQQRGEIGKNIDLELGQAYQLEAYSLDNHSIRLSIKQENIFTE